MECVNDVTISKSYVRTGSPNRSTFDLLFKGQHKQQINFSQETLIYKNISIGPNQTLTLDEARKVPEFYRSNLGE